MKKLASLLCAVGCAAAALAAETQFGKLVVVQNDTGNDATSVTCTKGAGSSAGWQITGQNRGDYNLAFDTGNDLGLGVPIACVIEDGRDNSAGGDAPGVHVATASIDGSSFYWIAVHDAPGGAEWNINTAFAYFPFDQWLAARVSNSVNNGELTTVVGTAGIDLDQEVKDAGVGTYTLDLRGLGGSSQNGILLVTGGRNEDNYALSCANADGTFTLICHDNGVDGSGGENDGVAFAYLSTADVDTKNLVAIGRVNGDGSTDVAGGVFTVSKGGTGIWYLAIPNESDSTGTLIVSPEGGDYYNVDNIVAACWDAGNGRWVITSRDLTGCGLQNGNSAEDMFSFAFFSVPPPQDARTTEYGYLANGLPAGLSDGTTRVANEWVAPGRLAAQETTTAGWTGRVAYRYDLGGAVTQMVAAAIGLTESVAYDGGGRETERVATCAGTSVTAAREYGSWNGLPSRMACGPVECESHFDILDRLTNLTWRADNEDVRKIEYQHDVLGQITCRVDRVGAAVTVRSYTYDALDRLASETVTQPDAPPHHCTYSYDDAGRRTAKYADSFDVLYSHGEGDRLAGWQVAAINTPACLVAGASSEVIGTDPRYGTNEVRGGYAGLVPTRASSNFSARVAFSGLGPQSVTAAISDAAGNVGLATNTFTLDAYTSAAYACDAAGCVSNITYTSASFACSARTLSWDAEYRLISVATNGVTAETYGYDPLGRRISTTSGGVTTYHLYDASWHTLADVDAAGNVIRSYLYGPGVDELLAMTVHQGAAAGTYFAVRDHQNTVWAWVDESGNVVESYDYDAWGRLLTVRQSDGLTVPQSLLGNRFLFQGREYAYATGLYQFRMRWYDPVTGRWLSNDPIGIGGGLNQYVFCANSLVNRVDPLGLQGLLPSVFWRSPGGHALGREIRGIESAIRGAGSRVADTVTPDPGFQSRFQESFSENRISGAQYLSPFPLPWGPVTTAGSEITARALEHAAVNRATSRTIFTPLGRSSVHVYGYAPQYFTYARYVRGLGVVSTCVTVFYAGADIGTALYSTVDAWKDGCE